MKPENGKEYFFIISDDKIWPLVGAKTFIDLFVASLPKIHPYQFRSIRSLDIYARAFK